jgi:hypothetical protein
MKYCWLSPIINLCLVSQSASKLPRQLDPYFYSDNPHIPPPQREDYFGYGHGKDSDPDWSQRDKDNNSIDDNLMFDQQYRRENDNIESMDGEQSASPALTRASLREMNGEQEMSVTELHRLLNGSQSVRSMSQSPSMDSSRFQAKIGHDETRSYTQQLMAASHVNPNKSYYSNSNILTRLCFAQGPLVKVSLNFIVVVLYFFH